MLFQERVRFFKLIGSGGNGSRKRVVKGEGNYGEKVWAKKGSENVDRTSQTARGPEF
jgi:hypothetical protein